LDDEEAALASSLTPLHTTLGAMSQYKNIERENQDSDGDRDGAVQHEIEEHDQGDAAAEPGDDADGNGEEGVGFLNNGICFLSFFHENCKNLLFFLRFQYLILKMDLHPHLLSLPLEVLVLILLYPQHFPRFPIKSLKSISPLGLVDWQLIQKLI
jgi:hypothetical protein